MEISFPRLAGGAGRLGNQLWEIAGTLGIARKIGADVKFPEWDYAPYFDVDPDLFGHDVAGLPDAADYATHIDPRARVYLQDYGLWSFMRDEIWEMFQPSSKAWNVIYDPKWDWLHKLEWSIALHVRRGDNVTHPVGIHPLRTMGYYKRAVDLMDPGKEATIVVFSDDIPWCKINIEDAIGRECLFVEGNMSRPEDWKREEYLAAPPMDWVDMQLMAQCDGHIISNSTYSWWGAFLARGTPVVYPSNWFGYKLDYIDASLMFPKEWVEVEDYPVGIKTRRR
jgi:hypothetical protein